MVTAVVCVIVTSPPVPVRNTPSFPSAIKGVLVLAYASGVNVTVHVYSCSDSSSIVRDTSTVPRLGRSSKAFFMACSPTSCGKAVVEYSPCTGQS